jgi:hypothetical protein
MDNAAGLRLLIDFSEAYDQISEYFSTSGGREVTTKRQLDGLCSLLKLTSHIPMFQDY